MSQKKYTKQGKSHIYCQARRKSSIVHPKKINAGFSALHTSRTYVISGLLSPKKCSSLSLKILYWTSFWGCRLLRKSLYLISLPLHVIILYVGSCLHLEIFLYEACCFISTWKSYKKIEGDKPVFSFFNVKKLRFIEEYFSLNLSTNLQILSSSYDQLGSKMHSSRYARCREDFFLIQQTCYIRNGFELILFFL